MPPVRERLDDDQGSFVVDQGCIHGTGEMADLIRSTNWAETALGPMDAWPETLVAAVNMMLASPLPVQLLWGPELVILYNDGLRATIADKHPAALGQPGRKVWEDAWPTVGHQLEAVLFRGEAVSVRDVPIPLFLNGKVTETWWDYSYSPVYAPDGTILGVLDIAQDTTQTVLVRNQQEELRKREALLAEELDQVLTATTDAVVSVDRDWRMTYFNAKAEELYGAASRYAHKTVWEAFPEARYEGSPFVKHFEAAMYEGVAAQFEAYYPEPLDFWIALNVYPTRNGIALFTRNVSETRKTHAALLQNEKLAAVGRLAASIAHEINNPLESVTNLLYLARTATHSGDIQSYLDMAERELRRVSVISNQTLRFYKQSTGPLQVTCNELFESVLSIYQGRLVNSRIEVEKRKRAHRTIECFEGEIRQVLNNLVGNAIDAMHPQGGRLLIRSRETTNWRTGQKGVALTVADTGTGMSPQSVKKVFDAFYTTKGIGGTGLGMWVSKEIVDRHGGTLHVRSSQNERHSGTVFVLFLLLRAVKR